jgi:hypothetical protein
MKKYNVQNYIRYKADVKKSIANLEGKFWMNTVEMNL